MRNLKRILLLGSCFIGMTAFGQNANQMNPQQRTDYIMQHVTDLTPEQRSRLLDIENEYQSQAKVVGGPLQIDSLQKATNVKIRGVLSNMQYEQYGNLNPYSK
jgi:hypothetical protein